MGAEFRSLPPVAVLRAPGTDAWWEFEGQCGVLEARGLRDVLPVVEEVQARTHRDRLHAVGFLAYESAPAFDPALPAVPDAAFPLAWFALFRRRSEVRGMLAPSCSLKEIDWTPSMDFHAYTAALAKVRERIGAGDTYQVNLTYRLRATFEGEPFDLFAKMAGDGSAPHAAYVDAGDWVVCSASPELFLRLEQGMVESRPMKGTARRGLWHEQDEERRETLRASEKERAENLMIVDMVRNDLGRVAVPGSVHVPSIFSIERYPTVWQMTSTVRAETREPLPGVLRAAFPPASITGAPKRRTMEIIAELEDSPRRAYTGAVGAISPEGGAQFNVAIRTALVHRPTRSVEYGVGGGIVWDSDPVREWEETRAKARVLSPRPTVFDLLETMLWTPEGCELLPYHLRRLERSAGYFGFAFDRPRIDRALEEAARAATSGPVRARLTLARDGAARLDARARGTAQEGFGRVALAAGPIDADDVFLYHKTTRRDTYRSVLRARPGCDDVLLFNGRGQATESTIANLAVEVGGRLCTPPVECGLLPGVQRAALLDQGVLAERPVTVAEVLASPRVLLLNAVRGMREVRIVVV